MTHLPQDIQGQSTGDDTADKVQQTKHLVTVLSKTQTAEEILNPGKNGLLTKHSMRYGYNLCELVIQIDWPSFTTLYFKTTLDYKTA